jgi:Rieske 2Fe-2S family protein
MRAPSEILSLLKSRRPGHTLPRAFYTDPAIYQADLESIWYRNWLFAGHDCELASAGAYFTLKVGDYPVVVLRGADGAIRAFHNSCRHRGSRICAAAKGAVAKLVCPYHSWTYELDGRLLYARDMDAAFDPKDHGLKPVHCASFGGYIWICVAPEAPDFARFRAGVEPYLVPHRLGEAKVAVENTIIENGNWKLVWENNRECYHCAANHPELCRTYPEDPTVTGVDGARDDPGIQASWQRWEAAGLPSHFEIAADGQYRATRMPLLREAESYTMSGKAAVRHRLSDAVVEPRIGTMLLFHYPTTWNHVMGDHAISFRVLPVGPGQTQVTTKWLVHKDAVAGVDYDIDELTKVWNATNVQDQRIVEENQLGVNSPAFEPGPYSTVHEDGVMQFLDWYAGALERGLGGSSIRLKSVA